MVEIKRKLIKSNQKKKGSLLALAGSMSNEEAEEMLKAIWENKYNENSSYVPFNPADYVDNPIALARINAGLTQKQLAKLLKVTQAYVSKVEKQITVTPKLLAKIKTVIKT